jgi:hypothetical protein
MTEYWPNPLRKEMEIDGLPVSPDVGANVSYGKLLQVQCGPRATKVKPSRSGGSQAVAPKICPNVHAAGEKYSSLVGSLARVKKTAVAGGHLSAVKAMGKAFRMPFVMGISVAPVERRTLLQLFFMKAPDDVGSMA